MRFLLVRSPLMGPTTWRAVADELAQRGHEVSIAEWPPLADIAPPYYPALASAAVASVQDGPPTIVVTHSGGGALIPSVAAAGPIAGAVFVDAILPHPGRSWLDTAPPELAAQLRAGAEAGRLPSWDQWWPPGTLPRLVPDPAVREPMIAELEAPPLAYFDEPAPEQPLDVPCAYLQLSGAYETEAARARLEGWPAAGMPLGHLAMLSRPAETALAIEALAEALSAPEAAEGAEAPPHDGTRRAP